MLGKGNSFIQAALRQKYVILGTVALFAMVSMAGFRFLTKKFKVQTTIGIQTQYFQIPLIRDFMPETFDGQELRAQRESLIRKALNMEYARELGKKYNLFRLQPGADEPSTADMAELISRFEIVPAGPSTYLVGFFSSNPYVGYQIMKDFIAHVKLVLAQERHAKLVRLHDAIQDRLEVLSFGKSGAAASPLLTKRPDLIKKEIDSIKQEIAVLKSTYSDRHPKVLALTKRLTEISKLLEPSSESPARPAAGNFSGAKVDDSSKELFQDLLKKYHYLEVVMFLDEQSMDSFLTTLQEPYVPSSPMWPKRPIILIWAVISGFLVGSLIALVLEIMARRNIVPSRAAVDMFRKAKSFATN